VTFPTVESITETSFGSASTNHAVNMPATVTTDDLLLIFMATYTDAAQTAPTDLGTWTQVHQGNSGSGFVAGGIYAIKAAGTEGGSTANVTTASSLAGAGQCFRITGWSGTIADLEASMDGYSSGTARSGSSLTPSWGQEDALWITMANTGDDDQAVTSSPFVANYTDGADTACGAGSNASGRIATAHRELNATSEDPGNFTIASSEAWAVGTLVVRTGSAGGLAAAVTGTAQPTLTESEVVSGGETIIITLTGDTFVAAGAGAIGSEADTQAIIDGVSAAASPANGWNNEVRDKEVIGSVSRDSDTQATITWTAAAAYSVAADETITVTVPAAALVTSASPLTATPTFVVTNEAAGNPWNYYAAA